MISKILKIIVIFSIQMISAQEKLELEKLSQNIQFKNLASTKLKKNSFFVLDSIADLIKKDTLNYQINSYSSHYGKKENNMIKTEKRANIIKEILVKKGVKPNRLIPVWFGEFNIFGTTCTKASLHINERIIITKKKGDNLLSD